MLEKIKKLIFTPYLSVQSNLGSVKNIILFGQLCYISITIAIFYTLFQMATSQIYITSLLVVFILIYCAAYWQDRKGYKDTSKYLLYISTNTWLFIFSSFLGSKAGIYLLYFPLICSTFLVYSPLEKDKIAFIIALSFAFLGLLDLTDHALFMLPVSTDLQHSYYAYAFLLSVAIIGFCINHLVTINNKTKAKLRDSEAKLSSILGALDEVVWAASIPDYTLLYVNAAAQHVYGFTSSEFLHDKKKWIEKVIPEDQARYKGFLQKVIEKGTDELEYRITSKNNEVRWLQDHCKVIRDKDGKPLRLEGTTTDITDRKRAEEIIKQHNETLNAILESTQSNIYAIDLDFNYISFNSKHQAIMKKAYNVDVELGMNISHGNHFGQDTRTVMGHFAKALKGDQFSVVEELGNKSVYRMFYETTYNPIQNEKNEVTGIAVFSRDITARKKTENELSRTNFELDNFVYRSSHDMRSPLRSILGLVNLIRMESDPAEHATLLGMIERSVNKLDTFILDLINFSRNSRVNVFTEHIHFSKIISECLDNLKYMENAGRVQVITDIECEEAFYSDSSRIGIIIQNLISNSIKYQRIQEEESYIKIVARCDKRFAYITIEDNGQGIDEAHMDKIFEMFYRATLDSYGSGLGLYIAKQVIEKLEGSISVESKSRVGTTFTINIPNHVPELAAHE